MAAHSAKAAKALHRLAGSLKLRVVVVSVLVLAVSVLLSSQVVLDRMGERAENAVAELERVNARRWAQQIDDRVRSARDALSASLNNMDWARELTPGQAQTFLYIRPVLTSIFASVFVASPQGTLLAMRDSAGTRDVTGSIPDVGGFFSRSVRERRSLLSASVDGLHPSLPVLVLTQPVLASDGTVLAVLCGTLRVDTVALDSSDLGGSAHVRTLVADEQGRIVAHADAARRGQPIETEPGLEGAARLLAEHGGATNPLAVVRVEPRHIISMAGTPSAAWLVFRIAPTEALLGEPRRARVQAWALAGASALVGGWVIYLLLGRLLRPLRLLELRAHALLDGSRQADEGWPQARGEIGELSRVLQHVMRERAQAERYSLDLLQKMHSVMAAAPIGLAFVRNRLFELVSHEYAALLGYEPQEMVGQTASRYYHDQDHYRGLARRVSAAFAAGQVFSDEFRFVRKDGTLFWGRTQGRPVDVADPTLGTIWLLADVTQEREARERLTWSATHDALTKLLNRGAFELQLRERLAARAEGQAAALLFIDLDRFKHVNDTAGHAAGDAVLERVAQTLSHRVRTTDLVGRLGGDEFAVLLSGCDRPLALRIAEQIRQGIEEAHVSWMGQRLGVGASVGVVDVGDGASADAAALLAAADAACYEAKHAGRNAVREARVAATGLRLVVGGAPAPE